MAKAEDKVLDHNYDGILEYDNPLPGWWVYLFVISIIWSVVYMFYYHVANIGDTQEEEYLAEFKMTGEQAEAMAAAMRKMWDNVKFVAVTEPEALTEGQEIYKVNCVSCHGAAGEGGIGPNLTDINWLHGGGIENVMKTVINGVPEKGMISWKPVLKPEQIQKVSSFILTLQGTNPPNGKAPQGDIWEPK